ncbi:gliding motility-associated protein GldE [bacterium AH-315-C07]|nr:gliding motility-associated protein GldE [bacterium AH-315-C07]
MIPVLILILALIICSALVSGSEVAFFSISPSRLADLKQKNGSLSKSDSTVLQLLKNPKRLLATILIANNFINVGIIMLGAYATSNIFDFTSNPILGFLVQVVVITFIILLLGEVLPKIYATQNEMRFSKFMAYPILILDKILYPLSSLLVSSTNIIDKRIQKKKHDLSVEDLTHVIEITTDETTTKEEKDMLKGIASLGTIQVKQIMKSRVDVTAFDLETNFQELLLQVRDSGFSRIPVFEETFDSVKGILYVKDLLMHLDEKSDFEWQKLVRPPYFVPETKKIDDLLKDFQKKKIHLAIVVDEYGGTSGIITLEDVLEEIVGEISDEFDEDEFKYAKVDDNTYIFDAKIPINDLCKIMKLEADTFDELKGESDSIGGLVLEISGKIPSKDEVVESSNFNFKILAVDNKRVKRIRISKVNNKSITN